MSLKNTDTNYIINKKNIYKKHIISDVVVFSLVINCMSISAQNISDRKKSQEQNGYYSSENSQDISYSEKEQDEYNSSENSQDISYSVKEQDEYNSSENILNISNRKKGQEQYGYYSSVYLNAMAEMDKSQFDSNFISIFKNGKYSINGIEYDIREIYIAKMDDGSVHLYKAGDNYKDVLTNQTFSGKKEILCCFRVSSIFYLLYKDGVFDNENIIVNPSLFQDYINRWDGLKHYEIPELQAEKVASEKFKEKNWR